MAPKLPLERDSEGPRTSQRNEKKPTVLEVPPMTPPTPYDNELDEDDQPKQKYAPSTVEKIINILLCRGDLANQVHDVKPVTLIGLFRFATFWDKVFFFIGVICAIISGISQPVLSIIAGRVTNVFLTYPPTSPEFRHYGYQNVFIFLGIGCFLLINNFIQYMCFTVVCGKVIAQIRHRYVKAILRQNAGWFDKNHSGTLTTKLNDNIERIREGLGDKLGLLIRGLAMFVSSIVIGFLYQWRLAFIMLGVTPCTCICMSLMARKMGSTTMLELKGVGKAGAIAEESILGVRTVQAFNGQEEMVERYRTELARGKRYAIEKSFWSGFFGGLFFFILFCFLASGFLFGGHLIVIGIIKQPGNCFIVIMSMLLGAYFLGLISPHLMVLLNARVAAASIYATIDRVPRIDPYSPLGKRPSACQGRVVFKDVHFRYPTRKNVKVLNGINLVIEPGQTVALVGHSGCGKSTSVGLITRLYEAESGVVTLDGNDVRELNIEWLRNVVGIVQQEPILFNDTIANNLRFGNPDITSEQMIKVCKMANAHDFIMKTPKGYETLIGDGGVQLSGGQKQRVAIARTLARDPKVLLLDEATSALDAQSESIVQSALDNAAQGRSTIVIAHRLSTVRNADKIVVFEKGNILEQGTHEELVAKGGKYYELVKAQQFQPEADEEEIPLDDEIVSDAPISSVGSRQSSFTRSGKEAFVRGTSVNDSFNQRASGVFEIDKSAVTAEDEAFAAAIQEEMDRDGRIDAGLLDIFKNAKGNYHWIFFGFICALFRGMELPSLALVFGYVFQALVPPYGSSTIHRLCMALIMYCSVGLGTFIFQWLSSIFFGIVSENLTMRFRVRTFRNILYQDASYFDNPQHAPGKLITRLATDAPNARAVVDMRMLQVIYGVTAIVVCIIIGFCYCWQVALLGTCVILLLAATQIGLAMAIQISNLRLIKSDDAGRSSIEIIENVRTIQLLTREQTFYHHYEKASKKQKRQEVNKGYLEAINFTISQSFLYFMMVLGFALGIYIIHENKKPADAVFRTIVAMLLGSVAVMNSATYFPEMVKARTAAGLLFNMIYRKPKTGNIDEGEKTELRGNILFDAVNFSYPQRPRQPVMKGLQFTATRGKTVALVGPSGSGKSTVISMLERFYDPTGGFVRFDGKDLKTLCLRHVRTQVALVGQEPRLFAGTIRDNICFGLGEVPESKIQEALTLANCKFIVNLPQGLETEVGEKGTQLSGGQKQRIAIARALVRDPKVLLLDEATSALDSESERAVQEALDVAREGRTCITIAHRLSSIQNSDLIIYIDGGRVRESGNHQELMQRKGRYYQLIKKQDLTT